MLFLAAIPYSGVHNFFHHFSADIGCASAVAGIRTVAAAPALAGVPAIAAIRTVAAVAALAGIPVVAGVRTVAAGPALAGVAAIDGVPADVVRLPITGRPCC